ncbi:MAG: calcium/sodium antiporter [Pseudomonadota bacterium]
MIANILLIAAGFGLLVFGGELLVRGAVSLAERLKVSAFIIGAVVIGFGSSTPELVTSIEAALIGAPGIAIGNIVGSNIINILVVLGIAGVIAPIALSGEHVRIDTIIVCALSAAFVALCTAFQLSPLIGAVLLIALAVYLTYSVRREMYSAGEGGDAEAEALDISVPSQSLPFAIGALIVGFGLLVMGGHFVVTSAIALAKTIGVSETIIGLTVVAFGTSLPEIVTAVIAAVRRHADVALGNVLGSCVFNLLAIAGVLSLISPINVPQAILQFDNLIMLAAASLLLLAVVAFRQIGRPLGVVFLGGYAAYLAAIWP